jgi:hypothetical protein
MRVAKINAVFEEMGGGTSSSWIWDSAKRLSKTNVEWECGEDGKRLIGVSNMMNAQTAKELRASGKLRFEIPALLGEVIKNPCRFSRLRLHFMIGLSGKYRVTVRIRAKMGNSGHTHSILSSFLTSSSCTS